MPFARTKRILSSKKRSQKLKRKKSTVKIKVKVKGSPTQVQKALKKLANGPTPEINQE